ncbi:MAG: LytTR family DNA-binding domain-containing protein [Lachnospiraceae bacterium]|nr:LytTR family DNA-binding domain-containing protein [Lachnospiraceae bacterium]
MRIAICDDSKLSQSLFISALLEWNPTERAECFFSGADLLKAMRQSPVFDMVFLDIYLPGENGVDIAAEIRKLSPSTGIVFITNSPDHAVDAYSLNAIHYLVKPVTAEGVKESFERLKNLRSRQRPMFTLSVGRVNHIVYLDEITCILSAKHVKEIHLENGQTLRAWIDIQELEKKLDKNFLKLNRGTIVNMGQIRQMSAEYCVLSDGTRLDFSRRKRAEIRDAYHEYLFANLSDGAETCG